MGEGVQPVGALVRRAAVTVRRRVLEALDGHGYHDIAPRHLLIFLWPGPEGTRPSLLASRAGKSKQAINQILTELEHLGYLLREPHPDDRRTRVVRLTPRGRSAYAVMAETVDVVGDEWRKAVGAERLSALHDALLGLDEHLDQRHRAS